MTTLEDPLFNPPIKVTPMHGAEPFEIAEIIVQALRDRGIHAYVDYWNEGTEAIFAEMT